MLHAVSAAIDVVVRHVSDDVRLVVTTPAAVWPAFLFMLLIVYTWIARVDRRQDPREPFFLALGLVCSICALLWFFHFGSVWWAQGGDWQKEWTYYSALKESVVALRPPYYLGVPFQGTERYLANPETLLTPDAVLLRIMSVPAFFMVHVLAWFIIGYCGLIALKLELGLSGFAWAILLVLFVLNGHITAHLGIGHTQWISYFLLPWVFLFLLRARGPYSTANAMMLALTFTAIILLGGWHIFIWMLVFTLVFCLMDRARIRFAASVVGIVTLLAAVRLAPSLLTYGGGTNTFLESFRSVPMLARALVGGPGSQGTGAFAWEFDTYVGYAGFALLCIAPMPPRSAPTLAAFAVPSVVLAAVSMFDIYKYTFFLLPGLVSERVVTRILIVPVLVALLAGCLKVDRWTIWGRGVGFRSALTLGAALFLVVQLIARADAWRPASAPAGPPPAVDALKMAPVEADYRWAVRVGAAVSVGSATFVGWSLVRRRVTSARP